MFFVHLASFGAQEWAGQVKERHQGAVAEGAKENGIHPALLQIYGFLCEHAEGMLSVPGNTAFPVNVTVVDCKYHLSSSYSLVTT